MVTRDDIINKIKILNFCSQGSGMGSIYHEIPFSEFCNIKSRRDINDERLKLMLLNGDFKEKKVLDIGCNIGYFCFKLANEGATCYGVDFDKDSIELAKMLSEYKGIKNVNFYDEKFDENFVEKILYETNGVDVIILTSVNHWLLYELHDINIIISLLRRLNNVKQVIYYEPSYSGEAFYPDQVRKKNVIYFLKKIGFNENKVLGKTYVSNVGVKRDLYLGENNFYTIVTELYKKYFSKKTNNIRHLYYNCYFIKAVPLNDPVFFSYMNEIYFYRMLKNKNYVPYYYRFVDYKNIRFFFFEKLDLQTLTRPKFNFIRLKKKYIDKPDGPDLLEKKLFNILTDLKKEKIIHRDILPRNIMLDRNISDVRIIDFQWAIIEGKEIKIESDAEKKELEKSLKIVGGGGVSRYKNPKLNSFSFESDEYAVRKIMEDMRKSLLRYKLESFFKNPIIYFLSLLKRRFNSLYKYWEKYVQK